MTERQAGYTKADPIYPGYVNLREIGPDRFTLTVRSDPTIVQGCFICGYARDAGQPGRCTPGDENCNNYCNMAPQKGPMADAPRDTTHTREGPSAAIELSREQLEAVLNLGAQVL